MRNKIRHMLTAGAAVLMIPVLCAQSAELCTVRAAEQTAQGTEAQNGQAAAAPTQAPVPVSVQAPATGATVTYGTQAAVATDSLADWPKAPQTGSETAVLIDAETGGVLYDKGMNELRYPASITKLMTLLLAVENSSPDDQVTFTETGIRDVTWDSSNAGMKLGETVTMKDCWYMAAIQSANEVCAQIAEYVGGTEENFINMMNEKAKELGCQNTHFANAGGLPDENHYTTALDMAKIMRAGLQNKRFRRVISVPGYTVPATNLSGKRSFHTHLPLIAKESNLYYPDCIGGKTGNTEAAGHTLAVAAERDGRTYIAVTMRAPDLGVNCTDSIALFDYAFNSFETVTVGDKQFTVPRGVTAEDLETKVMEDAEKPYTRFYYSGMYVGFVQNDRLPVTPTPSEGPEAVQTSAQDAGDDGAVRDDSSSVHTDQDDEGEPLSDTSRILLGVLGCMLLIVLVLAIMLFRKERR